MIDPTILLPILKNTPPFAYLDDNQIETALEYSTITEHEPEDILIQEGESDRDYLLCLAGALMVIKDGDLDSARQVGSIKAGEGVGEMALISSVPRQASVISKTRSKILRLNGDTMDRLLSWSQQFGEQLKRDALLRKRINLMGEGDDFSHLPVDLLADAIGQMEEIAVSNHETIVTQGDDGDAYYIIQSGTAEVWRKDVFTDELSMVARLKGGNTFGEEALLVNGSRNATITMTSDGTLLKLKKEQFDVLLKEHMVEEVDAETAIEMLQKPGVKLLDCRYDIEFEESRIPDADFVPLDKIRELAKDLDPFYEYIVYCRSGNRSISATYLLQQRNIKAYSLRGGISQWPNDIDDKIITVDT